jgi:serine/threonine protein kinase
LAPETAVSKRVPENGDIYSFGVLAYELLTGTTIDGGPDSPDEVVVDLLTDIHQHVIMDIVSPYNYLRREASFAGIPDPQLPPQQLSDIVMRCLGRDHNTRYSSLDALAFDLGQLAQICKNHGDLSKFQVGEIDALSKVEIPTRPIHRNTQLEQLQDAFKSLDTLDNKVANLSGRSGCGKARIVRHFVTQIEESEDCITAWGKSDEGVQAILSTVRQVIHALLDRCLTDPKEDLKAWTLRIKQALGHQFGMFASLISEEYKRILGVPADLRQEEQNWPSLLDSSGHWLRRFFDLFATKQRPLIIVLLDIQWMPQDERRIWQSLLEGSNALRHTLVISTLRTGQDSKPPLISATCTNIQVPPLTEKGVLDLIETCFHHRILSSQILASFLHAETGGVSLFLRTLLGTLVKEKVIYFDFVKLHWTFDPVQLHTHLSKSGVEGYLEKLILSLPQDVQSMLHVSRRIGRRS